MIPLASGVIPPVKDAPPPSPLIDGRTPDARIQAFARYCADAPSTARDPRGKLEELAAKIYAGRDVASNLAKWQTLAAVIYRDSKTRLDRNPNDANARNPFEKHALIHGYLACRDRAAFPPDAIEAMRKYVALYRHRQWIGYGALNYRLMNDGAGYLAAELWPDLVDADGLNASEIKSVTKARLFGYFDRIVRENADEYGAPTYLGIDFSAMKMLADFAQDPEMRKRASLTLDAMLLQVACAWNQGYYVTPASRAKYWGSSTTCPDHPDTTAGIGWLYFGGLRPVNAAAMNPGGSFWFAVVRDYHPPAVFAAIANDRSRPFVHRGSVHENIRFTIYHTPEYSLASEWERLPGPTDGHYKESRRNMFKWVSPRSNSTFVPLQENPQRPYRLSDLHANAFGYGENPFGQSLQHEGTLIGISSVPEDYPYWKSYAPFTTEGAILKRIEKDGWIFCHGGSVLFAFRYLQSAKWGPPNAAEHVDVLASEARKNGWILETSAVAPFSGGGVAAELDRFAAAVLERTHFDAAHIGDVTPSFCFRNLAGHELRITYRDHKTPYTNQHLIDGKPVDYLKYPLLGNPWVFQPLGSDQLEIRGPVGALRYDFKNWTRVPLESAR